MLLYEAPGYTIVQVGWNDFLRKLIPTYRSECKKVGRGYIQWDYAIFAGWVRPSTVASTRPSLVSRLNLALTRRRFSSLKDFRDGVTTLLLINIVINSRSRISFKCTKVHTLRLGLWVVVSVVVLAGWSWLMSSNCARSLLLCPYFQRAAVRTTEELRWPNSVVT